MTSTVICPLVGRSYAFGLVFALLLTGCGKPEGVGALKRIKQAKSNALAEIEARGGTATEEDYGRGKGYVLDLRAVPIDEEFLEQLAALKYITEIDLSGSNVSDEQLKKLAEVRGVGALLKLDVSDTEISDAGIMAFVEHWLLYQLDVANTNVTEAGMARFRKQHPKNSLGAPLKVTK